MGYGYKDVGADGAWRTTCGAAIHKGAGSDGAGENGIRRASIIGAGYGATNGADTSVGHGPHHDGGDNGFATHGPYAGSADARLDHGGHTYGAGATGSYSHRAKAGMCASGR